MKILVGIALLFTAATPIVSARVGDTEAELQDRYEKSFGDIPTEAFGPMRGFLSANYIVGVALLNGVSEMEMFSKSDQSDMTASEIQNFLKANGAGEWKAEPTGKPNWRRWRRDDQALVALYDTTRHFLYISSKRFYEEKSKKLEETEAKPAGSELQP